MIFEIAAELGLTPEAAGSIAYSDLLMLAATIERRRRNEAIRQDARFLGLIAAIGGMLSGKKWDPAAYFESMKDGRRGGEIRDPEQIRLALLAWCAATGGKIEKPDDTKPQSDEG